MPQTNRPQAKRHIRDPVTVWNNPRAYALCDGCKFLTYRDQLEMQMDYRGGTSPVWTGFLVCPQCNDTPNAQFAPPILKPDPVPTFMPRPDDEYSPFLITWSGDPLITNTAPESQAGVMTVTSQAPTSVYG